MTGLTLSYKSECDLSMLHLFKKSKKLYWEVINKKCIRRVILRKVIYNRKLIEVLREIN